MINEVIVAGKKFEVFDKEIIPVLKTDEGNLVVNVRELHEYLGVETPFHKWIRRKIEQYGFEPVTDFWTFLSESNGGRPSKEYIFKLDSAKELAMLENNEMGRKIRKYFIEVEKRARGLQKPMIYSYMIDDPIERAKMWIKEQEEKQRLQKQLEEAKPKIEFYEAFKASKSDVEVGDLARTLASAGIKIGRNRLFRWLRDNGYIRVTRVNNSRFNVPTQKAIELGILKQRQVTYSNGYVTNLIGFKTLVTPKGQIYFYKKLKQEQELCFQ